MRDTLSAVATASGENADVGGRAVFVVAAVALCWLAGEDVAFRDSGELGAAAYGLGVAHPTGFAFDLLVFRLFSYLPLGNIAWRQNVATALEAAAALGLLAHLSSRLARDLGVQDLGARIAGGAVAASGLFGWLTFSATARSVEVYSLGLLAVLAAASGLAHGRRTGIGVCCVVIGFAPGLHVTAGLFALLLLVGSLLRAHPLAAAKALWPRVPVVIAGALIIAYLPLASLRQPDLDWGDPETLRAVWDHLTAARIRSAYKGEMLRSGAHGALAVFDQLAELWPLMPFMAFALALGFIRRRALVVLAPLSIVVADLAYATTINPMGAVDRQVGHIAGAGIALLGGIGVSALIGYAHGHRLWRGFAILSAAGFATGLAMRLPTADLHDGYAANELFGGGGPMARVPPRTLVVCRTDDACAGGLFAAYVEAIRPDVDVVPAQHLWERTVVRRIGHGRVVDAILARHLEPAERADASNAVLRWLAGAKAPRPVLFESAEALNGIGYKGTTHLSQSVPYIETSAPGAAPTIMAAEVLERLDALSRARVDGDFPRAERAQEAWAGVYDGVGAQMLASDPKQAARSFQRAIDFAPTGATHVTNLGVAREAMGDLGGAVTSAERAIALAPERPTAWLNLARLRLKLRDPGAARQVLDLAARANVHDPRLDELSRQLAP